MIGFRSKDYGDTFYLVGAVRYLLDTDSKHADIAMSELYPGSIKTSQQWLQFLVNHRRYITAPVFHTAALTPLQHEVARVSSNLLLQETSSSTLSAASSSTTSVVSVLETLMSLPGACWRLQSTILTQHICRLKSPSLSTIHYSSAKIKGHTSPMARTQAMSNNRTPFEGHDSHSAMQHRQSSWWRWSGACALPPALHQFLHRSTTSYTCRHLGIVSLQRPHARRCLTMQTTIKLFWNVIRLLPKCGGFKK